MHRPARSADPSTSSGAPRCWSSVRQPTSPCRTRRAGRVPRLPRDLRHEPSSSENRLRRRRPRNTETAVCTRQTVGTPARDWRRFWRAAQPVDRYPAGFPRGSLAEALQPTPVGGQILGTFREPTNAAPGEFERASPSTLRRETPLYRKYRRKISLRQTTKKSRRHRPLKTCDRMCRSKCGSVPWWRLRRRLRQVSGNACAPVSPCPKSKTRWLQGTKPGT